ncbi:7-cyano-7-deazaguanine synthase [Sorangium sp. So ce1014]|uniref:7-cyano-7-deazaguanine synthase n=1 Tax=Sorangium sp. So ce1014 TaxID=3133326 RepID=UPI003F5DCCA4
MRGIARDLAWQREIRVQIAVEDPARWCLAVETLQRLLSFMTDDTWELSFEGALPAAKQQVLFPADGEPPTEVALFSGGLDSVAGLYARSIANNGTYVAVSACGNEVRGKAQADGLACLRELGVKLRWVKLVHQLRGTHRTRREMEVSQRSRGLLFLAMGAACASSLGLGTVNVYETGVGCINLPTSSAQVASQGTRAMHPFTLASASKLFSLVLDRSVRVVAPFFFHTKGTLCRETGAALPQLARVAMSCDEGEGHKPDAMAHCGLCTSCIFRRVALFAAGLANDPTSYRDIPTRRHGLYEIRAFQYHADQLAKCLIFGDLVELDPDARFAACPPTEDSLTTNEAQCRVLAMYATYHQELSEFLARACPVIQPRLKRPRKEKESDLFAATG